MSPIEHDDEITFKEILLIFKEYFKEIKNRWRVLLFLFLIIGGIMTINAWTTEETYIAKLNFMINEEDRGIGGGLGSILGDFGFGGGGEQNLEKILQMAQSRKIFGLVVFDSIDGETEKKLLANELISELKEHHNFIKKPKYKFWEKESALKDFQFQRSNLEEFNRLERMAFLGMYAKLSKIFTSKIDEDTGIMDLTISTHSEDLSYNLCHQFFKKLSNFYIEKSIEKQKETYRLINEKVDSISALINQKQYIIAEYKDGYRNIWQQKAKVPISAMKKEVQMLYLMLGEAIKNKEIADFALNSHTPFIQVIDEPIKPLIVIKPTLLDALFRSFIVALLLGVTFIVLSKWLKELL